MLLTSEKWLFEFFEQVAEADRPHFARVPGATNRSGRSRS